MRRLVHLVRYSPFDGALYQATHDQQGTPTYATAAAPSAPKNEIVVTSLAGVNLANLYAGAEASALNN